MIDFELQIDPKEVERAIDELGDKARPAIALIALRAGQVFEGAMRREIVGRLTKGPTGAMARAVRTTPEKVAGDEVAGAFVGVYTPYAAIQNDGGTIHAKGKLLAVPIRGAGVPKGKWPRDWSKGELHLIPRRGKPSLLATVSKRGEISPKYVLMDAVKIPGVHYAEAALDSVGSAIEDLIASELTALFDSVGR